MILLVLFGISMALLFDPLWSLLAALGTSSGMLGPLLRWSSLELLLRSLLIAGVIGILSIFLAIPLARVLVSRLTRRGAVLAAMLIAPIWLPSFMIYAAGNLMRAPDTLIGSALIEFSTSSPDRRWVTIWAGYLISVLGLALWSTPLSAVLIASGMGNRSDLYDRMLALEPIGRLQRGWTLMMIHRRALVRAWVLVSVMMLGSAVPLHLAQLDTWSIVIWRQLSERAPEQWGSVWVSAMPMLLIALLGARVLSRSLRRTDEQIDPGYESARATRTTWVLSLLVWGLAVLLPMISMLISLRDWRSIPNFWHEQYHAVFDSGLLAIGSGALATLIALLTALVLSSPDRAAQILGRVSLLIFCTLGLMPGVLVGASVARHGVLGWHQPWMSAFWSSSIRVAFIGAIIGALCAGCETRDRRSARLQMCGSSALGWFRTVLPSVAIPLLATWPIASLMSLFEIEASVMVRPPGMENLPQQLLSDLHYARLERLSAAGINLLLLGMLGAMLGSWMLLVLGKKRRVGNHAEQDGYTIV